MMKYFIDKVTGMSKHAISCAAIIDSQGREAGFIHIRFTDATIGWNHEGQLIGLSDSITFKGSTYDNPQSLVEKIKEKGWTPLGWSKTPITGNGEYLNRFSDVRSIRVGRKHYRIIWVQ